MEKLSLCQNKSSVISTQLSITITAKFCRLKKGFKSQYSTFLTVRLNFHYKAQFFIIIKLLLSYPLVLNWLFEASVLPQVKR